MRTNVDTRKASYVLILLAALALLVIAPTTTFAQKQLMGPDDETIGKERKAAVIDSVLQAIDETYVYPEKAEEMAKFVHKQFKSGAYDEISSAREFGMQLTKDLRSICNDRHLGVRYFKMDGKMPPDPDNLTPEQKQEKLHELQQGNFAFKELKILPGNIGYIKMDAFIDAGYAGQTAIAAMNFLAYTDAVIFDLRENGGGSPSMIQLISSYLFDEPKHLNSFYIRKGDTTEQFWTQAYVVGPKMTKTDVYILTSSYTFSGAEEFTYNLKNMKRATVIGETTGGGAHPVETDFFPSLNFGVRVPFGKAVNPITGTNWEGVGIEPDVKIEADKALDKAYLMALEKLDKENPEGPGSYQRVWAIDGLKAKLNPVTLTDAELNEYVGSYGPRQIRMGEGHLVYQRETNPEFTLVPIGDDTFMLKELDYFRIKFDRDKEGKIIGIIGLYDDGHTDYSPLDGTQTAKS